MSDLDGWGKIIREQGERYRKEREAKASQLKARTPDAIVRIEGEEHQFGYYRADNGQGVVRFTRWGDDGNWLPETKVEFTWDEIKTLSTFLR